MGKMKWAWKAGRFAGIDVYVHATFAILMAWVVLSYWVRYGSAGRVLGGAAFTLALFGCVLLHEYGHALAARRYGIRTRDITLLPIGGVARLERMPSDPRQELWVALAGPAVNVAIAGVLALWLQATHGWEALSHLSLTGGSTAERLLVANLFIVGFNLLPAFPMDGGRVLRALMAMRSGHLRATRVAAGLGQGMAFLFGLAGLFGNPFLIFIALFVWIGASQEAAAAQAQTWLAGVPAERVMMTDFRALSPGDYLDRAVHLTLTGSQQDFPVVDRGRVVGLLTREDLVAALAANGPRVRVEESMCRAFETAGTMEPLERLMERMETAHCHAVPVLDDAGGLAGLVTMENISEFVVFRSALEKAPARPALEDLIRA